jgi:hypothetical protein
VASEGTGQQRKLRERLLATLEAAVGTATRRALADSEDAQADVPSLAQRFRDRLMHGEARRQANLEAIFALALDQIATRTAGSGRVDPVWLDRFVALAGTVHDEELRKVWGLALAQEAARPGSIARRTLAVLADLEPRDLALFAKLARFVILNFVVRLEDAFFVDKGLQVDDFLYFEEIGLVRSGGGQAKTFTSQADDSFVTHLLYRDRVLRVTHDDAGKTLSFPCYRLTTAGSELSELVDCAEDNDYVVGVVSLLRKKGYKAFHADILRRGDRNTVLKHSRFCEIEIWEHRRKQRLARRDR